jgi:hypothetical protein
MHLSAFIVVIFLVVLIIVVIFLVVLNIVGLLLVLVEVEDVFKVVMLLNILALVITDVFVEIVFKLPVRALLLLLFDDVCILVVIGLVCLGVNENGSGAHDRPLGHVVELH